MTTTKAATKRAERERRRANGEKRVEVWLSPENAAWVAVERDRCGMGSAEIIHDCIDYVRISVLT